MKRLSIIVPVYNVAQYLAKCLDSLLGQELPADDCEIIVVNDGSTDGSPDIARRYADSHPDIIYIDQQNQGVSVARNAGLARATGTFVLFVDPDDWIAPHSIRPILEHAAQHRLDVLYLGFDTYDERGDFIRHVEACGAEGIVEKGTVHPRRTYPATLYRREIIGGIRFVPGVIRGQDSVFNIMVQSMASRCSYFGHPYYCYLLRDSSSRQVQGSQQNFESTLLAMASIENFRKAHFPKQTAQEKAYFDKAILVFVQRTLEWNILPSRDRANFDRLKSHLKNLEIGYLIARQAQATAGFDLPFPLFAFVQKLSGYWAACKGKFSSSRP